MITSGFDANPAIGDPLEFCAEIEFNWLALPSLFRVAGIGIGKVAVL
jgi:hypothetical protein